MTPETIVEIKGLIALGMNGSPFTHYAASNILSCLRIRHELVRNGALFWILVSAIRRHDMRGAFQFCLDWSDPHSLPTAMFKKFDPGDHWHVLGEKFNSFAEAETYATQQGYRYGGREIIRVPREGD